jgi:hypothetical protein
MQGAAIARGSDKCWKLRAESETDGPGEVGSRYISPHPPLQSIHADFLTYFLMPRTAIGRVPTADLGGYRDGAGSRCQREVWYDLFHHARTAIPRL